MKGVRNEWLNEDDRIVPKCFIKAHTNNNCISTQRVKEVVDKIGIIVLRTSIEDWEALAHQNDDNFVVLKSKASKIIKDTLLKELGIGE